MTEQVPEFAIQVSSQEEWDEVTSRFSINWEKSNFEIAYIKYAPNLAICPNRGTYASIDHWVDNEKMVVISFEEFIKKYNVPKIRFL